jgi:hypothetical protein
VCEYSGAKKMSKLAGLFATGACGDVTWRGEFQCQAWLAPARQERTERTRHKFKGLVVVLISTNQMASTHVAPLQALANCRNRIKVCRECECMYTERRIFRRFSCQNHDSSSLLVHYVALEYIRLGASMCRRPTGNTRKKVS